MWKTLAQERYSQLAAPRLQPIRRNFPNESWGSLPLILVYQTDRAGPTEEHGQSERGWGGGCGRTTASEDYSRTDTIIMAWLPCLATTPLLSSERSDGGICFLPLPSRGFSHTRKAGIMQSLIQFLRTFLHFQAKTEVNWSPGNEGFAHVKGTGRVCSLLVLWWSHKPDMNWRYFLLSIFYSSSFCSGTHKRGL